MIIIGLDPGTGGGMAVITPARAEVHAYKFTTMTDTDIWNAILEESLAGPCRAFLEKVHGMPGCGGQFAFGEKFGFLKGCMTGGGIPFELVPPQNWMRGVGMAGLGLEQSKRKKALKEKAQQLFPKLKVTLADADALLLAEYGYRTIYERDR